MQLVTAKFPTPFYRIAADQYYLKNKRRKGKKERENKIIKILVYLVDRSSAKAIDTKGQN